MSAAAVPSRFHWRDGAVWRRAAANTLRCLGGCSLGDFGALFLMQHSGVGLSTGASMAVAMTCGIATSFAIETAWLYAAPSTRMPLATAARTAFSMSMVSMVAMELAENAVDLHLTGGVFAPHEPAWWGALAAALVAGFVTPLPYNYYMLKRWAKACH